MPEPPKITTSLAERIARLNATQSNSPDRNQGRGQQEIGEIRSKISKYEATGQHEAPLVPKGSFGLGAPLTKPDRGLDRIRIASLGVSGGTRVAPSVAAPASRSVSVGGTRSPLQAAVPELLPTEEHLEQQADEPEPATTLTEMPATCVVEKLDSSDGDREAETRSSRHSSDSADAYDGILDGYPTTPAEGEGGTPMVTCSDCSSLVELEQLGEHICQLTLEKSDEEHRRPVPADVPIDADQCSSNSDPAPDHSGLPELDVPEEVETSSTSSVPQDEAPPKADSVLPSHASPQPTLVVEQDLLQSPAHSEPAPAGTKHQPLSAEARRASHQSPSVRRISDSSNSTNTRAGRSEPPSSVRHSWYDDEGEQAYEQSTGFVTIVRSSNRC